MAAPPHRPPRRPQAGMPVWMKAMLGALFGVALLAVGALGARLYERYGDQMVRARDQLRSLKDKTHLPDVSLAKVVGRGPSKIVYLNREGATLTAGVDDASENVSSIVAGAGLNWVDVPAFAGTNARWDQIVRCVRSKFEAYDVTVTDQRPVNESYVMAMVGGTPKGVLGDDIPLATKNVTGLAPFNGDAIRGAVVMVFSRAMREATRPVCETAAMEVAHAFGLDHARNCKDIMTYMKPCGAKQFLDKPIACGEYEDRACKGGEPAQNSHARLLAILGPVPESRPARPPQKGATRETGTKISAGPVVADDGHFHVH